MQNTTADYKLEINKPSRSFECKITIGDNIYNNEDLVNLILEHTQPQDGFSIGNTVSQSLDLTLLNRGDIIFSTSQIKVEIGLKIGNKIEYIPMGIFNIDDIEKTDYTTKITAYDNMVKFESDYFSNLGDKPTLQQVVNELSEKTGVKFTGSLPAYTVSKLDGFSCREVLSYVASICGGNAFITRYGKFTIKNLNEVEKSIDGNNYFDYKREEVKYKIGQVSCQVGEKNILSKGSLGTDSMELQFENPWMTETILTEIYNKLKGLSYLGYSMKWQGDLSLDPYDIITVTDVKNVVRKIPILSQKLNYTGGLTSEIGAKGETKNKNSFSSSGSVANKVNRTVIEQAMIKDALIEKANIKDLQAVSIRTQNLEAKTAKIEEAIIGVVHVTDLNAINANIENLIAADATISNALIGKADITELNAVQGNITSLNSQVANIQTLVNGNLSSENIQAGGITSDRLTISNGFITNAMIASLDVSKINAGTISTNKFRIVSDNGGIEIVGATQQFKDKNNKVRIQMGQDTQGNFNFILCGADGTTTLIDHTGIKEKAIADNLIKENMVAADAIGEKQINYSSLITGLNKDTNTQLIKASKVAIDLTGQSLEVAFNSLKSSVDNTNIGGRNLILNANWSNGLNVNWTSNSNFILIEAESDKPNSRVVFYSKSELTENTNAQKWCKEIYIQELGETEFTFSFDIKSPNWNEVTTNSTLACVRTFNELGKTAQADSVYYYNVTVNNINIKKINNKWARAFITIKPTKGKYVRFGIYANRNGTLYFREVKAEIGNKATDFTVAQEDVDSKIESNSTTINVMQGQIATAINNTQIVKDGQTILLKDDYNRTVSKVDSINSTIGTHTTKLDQLTGNITNVDTKVNAVQRDLEGTKSTVSSHTSQISGLNSTVNTQSSSINQLKNQIALKVESTDVTEAINNIKIGGENYVKDCKFQKDNVWSKSRAEAKISTSGGYGYLTTSTENPHIYQRFQANEFKIGDTLTIQYEIKCSSVLPNTGDDSFLIRVQLTGYDENGSHVRDVGIFGKHESDYSKFNNWTKLVKTLKLTGDNNFNFTALRLYARNFKGSIYFRNIKLEKGDKATDLSLAQSDIDSAISTVDGKVTTTNNKVATIETNLNSITSRVSSTESTVSTHTTQLGTVDNRINTAKNSAINTASTDATNKANNALNSAKSYTNGQISTVNKTITDKVAEIKTTTDSITQKVSSADSKITTINNNITSLQNRMNSAESKITDSAIINTVKSTINTAKTEAINSANSSTDNKLKNYATTSSLIQTEKNITAKFEESGGYNIVENSTGYNKVANGWANTGNNATKIKTAYATNTRLKTGYYFILNRDNETDTNANAGVSRRFKLKPNTTYTVSGMLQANAKTKGIRFMVKTSDIIEATDVENRKDHTTTYTVFRGKLSSFTKKSLSFTTGANVKSGVIYLEHLGYDSTDTGTTTNRVYWSEIMLSEGDIEQQWTPHPNEVYSGSTVIDATGVTVNNGALRVKNNAGTTVLEGDSSGNLIISGTMKSQNGDMYVALDAGGVTFQDWHRKEQMLSVGISYFDSNRDMNGVTFAMPQYGDFIRFAHIAKPDLTSGWSSSDTQNIFMDIWSGTHTFGGKTYEKGIHAYAPLYIYEDIKLKHTGNANYPNRIVSAAWNSINGLLGIYGDKGAILGYQNGSNIAARIVVSEGAHPGTGDNIKSWGNWNCSGSTVHNATFSGRFVNSYANTITRSSSQTHCIEAESKQIRINFKDVQIKNGKTILNIPNRYVGMNNGYIISSIVKKGQGDVWISEEQETRFILEGTKDIKINVEIIILLNDDASYNFKTINESQLCIDASTKEIIN